MPWRKYTCSASPTFTAALAVTAAWVAAEKAPACRPCCWRLAARSAEAWASLASSLRTSWISGARELYTPADCWKLASAAFVWACSRS